MKNFLRGSIAAFVLLCGSTGALAEEAKAPATLTETFVQNLGMTEVLPNFYLSAQQMRELRNSQCTAGPSGLFNEFRLKMEKKGWVWCSREANAELDSFFKSGAVGYTLTALPTSARLTVYDQAVNLNRNVKCTTDIPYQGVFELNFTCYDSKSGKQVTSEIIGTILGNTIPLVASAVASNLTAPDAGDSNITVGSQSGSTSEAAATGGSGGSVPDIHINNNPLFNPAFNVNAGANAEINGPTAPCGTPVCH
jgi:hypothetical protein